MKAQEIFDTVAIHLFDQGERSVDNHVCRYRNDHGLKCAVGILIPDEDYFPEMDQGNKTIKNLIELYPDKFPEWMSDNLGLIQTLQSVHDKQYNWKSSDKMHDALVDVASVFEVNPDILEELSFEEEEDEDGE